MFKKTPCALQIYGLAMLNAIKETTRVDILIEEINRFAELHPDCKWVDIFASDINGRLSGKKLPFEKLASLARSGFRIPPATFACDVSGDIVSRAGFGADADGDADNKCSLIPGTLTYVPWALTPTAQVMMEMWRGNELFDGFPRAILSRVLSQYSRYGLTPVVAVELEFYIVDRNWRQGEPIRPAQSERTRRRLSGFPSLSMAALDDFETCLLAIVEAAKKMDVAATTIQSEYAPGQFEINLSHREDAIRAADDGLLLKRVVKAVCQLHDLDATFMAKPYSERVGSGLHIHVSLVDDQRRNILELPNCDVYLDNMVGGLCSSMPEFTAIFAPSANSFRRLGRTPSAPRRASWAYDNRNAAVRIIKEGPGSTRIEHRVAGADSQIHLSLAAVLAGILHGLENRCVSPPPLKILDYTDADLKLPLDWRSALDEFRDGSVVKNYFGEWFQKFFYEIKNHEYEKFVGVVTDHERGLYFDAV